MLLSLSFWDWWDIAGVVAVLLGVAFGFWMSRKKYVARETPMEQWEARRKKWEHFWEYVLIIGLGMELLGTGHHIKESAELKKETEELKNQNLKLGSRIAWRRVDRSFGKMLSLKKKGSAEIVYKKDDSEAYAFAEELLEELRIGGWSVESRPQAKETHGHVPFMLSEAGVISSDMDVPTIAVLTSGELPKSPYIEDIPIAALMNAFSVSGFRPNLLSPQEGIRPSEGVVRIVIGSRL